MGIRRLYERRMVTYLRRRGFAVSRYPAANPRDDYYLHDYTGKDGTFDYSAYFRTQTEGNRQKITSVWADEATIGFLSDYILKSMPHARRGLCHGTRNGAEIRWFREKLGFDVIGTDISDTATQFPHTVQWDFHQQNPEWVGAFDFVYTNSHDHAYDPARAFDVWVEQLAPGGALLIEHTMEQSEVGANKLDPFGVNPKVFPYLILIWSKGRYTVTRLLEPPHTKPNGSRIWIFVIQKV